MTWRKYDGNPVLTRNSANFRDPKVFRYQGDSGAYWVMAAVEAQEQKVVLYRSDDLRSWDFLSDFGPANADGGEWECPDLFPLPVDGDPDNITWVLIVNVNPGAVAGGSGGQYFTGHFDGVRFLPDAGSLAAPAGVSSLDPGARAAALQECLWLDWGRDCYASVSFSDAPDGRRIIIGWMNNWDYANELPTHPWRSSMTLARELRLSTAGLTAAGGSPRLFQQPVLEPDLDGPSTELMDAGTFELQDAGFRLPDAVPGGAQVIEAEIVPGSAEYVEFRLLSSASQGTVLRYDARSGRLILDRGNSGNTAFHGKFASAESAPLVLEGGALKLLIVVDHCSVEVFAQGGAVVLTDLVFPDPGQPENWLSATGGPATILKLTVSTLA
jgi:levanase/levanbiose-producing levanase